VLGAFGDLGVALAVWKTGHAHDELRWYMYRARGWYIISNLSVSEQTLGVTAIFQLSFSFLHFLVGLRNVTRVYRVCARLRAALASSGR
jgi:presenilin-like A22 family membrane protease